jgi:hypothetical protein
VTKYSIILFDWCIENLLNIFSTTNQKEKLIISQILAENSKKNKLSKDIQVKLIKFITDRNEIIRLNIISTFLNHS